jgi:hypothetical protein
MTDKPDDGGSAFPIPNATDLDGYVYAPESHGMSLREYFAGQAMAAMMGGADNPEQAAFWAVEAADALIARLKGGNQ